MLIGVYKNRLPLIYFLSTGRTGTNLIYNVMRYAYPEVGIAHQKRYSRLLNVIGNILLIAPFASPYIQTFFHLLKKTKIPESTVDPLLSIPISLLLKKRPLSIDHKIVHIVRDPRGFVSSFMNWKNQKIRRVFLHHFVPFWQPNPILCDDISIIKRIGMGKFEYFCWIWNFKNSFFAKLFKHKENYYLVRMEDLVDAQKGHQNFRKLFDFLELPSGKRDWDHLLNRKVNASTRNGFTNWKNWNSRQVEILDRYCGDLMRKYSYGNEESWIEKLREE